MNWSPARGTAVDPVVLLTGAIDPGHLVGIRHGQSIDQPPQGIVPVAGLAADLERQVDLRGTLAFLLQKLLHLYQVRLHCGVPIFLVPLDHTGDRLLVVDIETDILGVHGAS